MGEGTPNSSDEEIFRRVRDGEPLRSLASGLVIIRRRKHEPVDFSGLTKDDIVSRTSKRSGSKFLIDWTLTRYVAWIEAEINILGWTDDTGPATAVVQFTERVGISRGSHVKRVRLRSDGRNVHAYPEE